MLPVEAALPQSAPVCPEHPEQASIATCERCGRFLCEACAVSREPVRCARCHQLVGDVYGVLSQPFSIRGSLERGWQLFRSAVPTGILLAVVFGIPGGLFTHFLESWTESAGYTMRLTMLYEGTVGLVGVCAWLALLVGIAEGRRPGLVEVLQQGGAAWPRVFFANFRRGIMVLLYALLLIIPGAVKAVTLGLTTESAFREPGADALDTSTRLVTGRRWEVLWTFLLSYLPIIVMTMGAAVVLGVISGLAPATATVCTVLIDIVGRLMEGFAAAVGLCAWYGFKNLHGEKLEPR